MREVLTLSVYRREMLLVSDKRCWHKLTIVKRGAGSIWIEKRVTSKPGSEVLAPPD